MDVYSNYCKIFFCVILKERKKERKKGKTKKDTYSDVQILSIFFMKINNMK